MPKREIVLSDGKVISKNITSVHPDGEEFLPENFTIPADAGERGLRIYHLIAEIVGNISANKSSGSYSPREEKSK